MLSNQGFLIKMLAQNMHQIGFIHYFICQNASASGDKVPQTP